MAPVACPVCNSEMKVKSHVGDHYCVGCQRWYSPAYMDACNRCSQLDAVMYSPNYIKIKPRRGMDDARMIDVLFDKADRHYNWWQGWMIYNAPKYAHLTCVQSAVKAFLKQYSFLEMV